MIRVTRANIFGIIEYFHSSVISVIWVLAVISRERNMSMHGILILIFKREQQRAALSIMFTNLVGGHSIFPLSKVLPITTKRKKPTIPLSSETCTTAAFQF
jgi:hypothetical protein